MNAKLHSLLYDQPWLITPGGWKTFAALVRDDEDETPAEEKERVRMMPGGVAVVPVKGVLAKVERDWLGFFGILPHDVVGDDLDSAVASGAQSIVLDFDSPGGTVQGTEELGRKIDALDASGVPVIAWTETQMCSAAYWIGCGATIIGASPSAHVGSVGTILEVTNFAEALEQMGVEVDIFTGANGDLKSTGHPAQRLSDSQRAWLQEWVDNAALAFQSRVVLNRPAVDLDSMRGQIFTGAQGAGNGMVDMVADSFSEFLAALGLNKSP